MSQLQAIGIRSRLQVMERGVFLKQMQGSLRDWPGVADHPHRNAHRRHVVQLVRHDVQVRRLPGQGLLLRQGPRRPVRQKYLASYDKAERKQLAEQIQTNDAGRILFRAGVPPRLRQCDRAARRGATKWQDVFPTITTGYAYPWEDIQLA